VPRQPPRAEGRPKCSRQSVPYPRKPAERKRGKSPNRHLNNAHDLEPKGRPEYSAKAAPKIAVELSQTGCGADILRAVEASRWSGRGEPNDYEWREEARPYSSALLFRAV
jgi:hypothetical protein